MYTYLKRALLVISLLALPSMNMVVSAMEDKDENPCRTMIVWKDKNEILNPCRTMALPQDVEVANGTQPTLGKKIFDTAIDLASAAKSGVHGVMNGAYNFASFANEHPVLTGVVAFRGLVGLAAACKCICWPDPHSPPNPLYLGEQGGNAYCQQQCWQNNYMINFTCTPTKRSDLW